MKKDKFLAIRITSPMKSRIQKITELRGISIGQFCRMAVIQALSREEEALGDGPDHFEGVPEFVNEMCSEIQKGGSPGYTGLGRELARQTPQLVKARDEVHRREKIVRFTEMLTYADDDLIITWYQREFPNCMALVPVSKRRQFVMGVRQHVVCVAGSQL